MQVVETHQYVLTCYLALVDIPTSCSIKCYIISEADKTSERSDRSWKNPVEKMSIQLVERKAVVATSKLNCSALLVTIVSEHLCLP
jgi:hypothetical protein